METETYIYYLKKCGSKLNQQHLPVPVANLSTTYDRHPSQHALDLNV